MFLNFTNHPADTWSADQRRAAQQYGPIADMPFPDVPPALSAAETAAVADVWAARILDLHPACVLCQGEMTLTSAWYGCCRRRALPWWPPAASAAPCALPMPTAAPAARRNSALSVSARTLEPL